MSKKRCLVTGHKGYIGSKLYNKLKSQGYPVAGIDLKGCDIEDKALPGENICEGYPIEFYSFNPDVVFHLAAIPRVGYSVEHPVEVMRNNVMSTSITLKFAKYFKIPVVGNPHIRTAVPVSLDYDGKLKFQSIILLNAL